MTELSVRLVSPSNYDLGETISTLFLGREVKVRDAQPWTPSSQDLISVYRDDESAMRGVWIVEFPLAAALASAVVTMPTTRVGEALEAGSLDPVLAENFREVVNVLGYFMNGRESARLRLMEIGNFPEHVDEVRQRTWAQRVHCSVAVKDYGDGNMTWVVG